MAVHLNDGRLSVCIFDRPDRDEVERSLPVRRKLVADVDGVGPGAKEAPGAVVEVDRAGRAQPQVKALGSEVRNAQDAGLGSLRVELLA